MSLLSRALSAPFSLLRAFASGSSRARRRAITPQALRTGVGVGAQGEGVGAQGEGVGAQGEGADARGEVASQSAHGACRRSEVEGDLRVLLLSADVGESHRVMADALASALAKRSDVAEASVSYDFTVLGPVLRWILTRGFRFHLGKVQWSYHLAYKLFTGVKPARAFGEHALYLLGGPPLRAAIARFRPDVVVSTYPVITPILGKLRARGKIECQVAAIVAPLGGLGFWAHRGIDLHLLIYREARPSVERVVGAARIQLARPLVRDEFFSTRPSVTARAALAIPEGRRVVVICGGGWGAGDIEGAVAVALSLPHMHVIAVAGRNRQLQAALAAAFAGDERVWVHGFTTEMASLLAAADVLVTSTAGISCIEAQLSGCETICYGFLVGHVRDNARALAEHGYVRVAATAAQLQHELLRALEAGRQDPPSSVELPDPAELIVELAR